MRTSQDSARPGLRERICYGVGAVGYEPIITLCTSYLMFFCTESLGIAAATAGLAILIPNLVDIVASLPFMAFVDGRRTRWGIYRPWLLTGIPAALFGLLLFVLTPEITAEPARVALVFALYLGIMLCSSTGYWCPYVTLASVISPHEEDRVSMISLRVGIDFIVSCVTSALTMALVVGIGGSTKDARGWALMVIIAAIFTLIGTLICFFGVRERMDAGARGQELNAANSQGTNRRTPLRKRVALLIRWPSFRRVALMIVVLFMAWYVNLTLDPYFFTYGLNHEDWMSQVSLITMVFAGTTAAIAPRIESRIGARRLTFLAGALVLAGLIIQLFAQSFAGAALFAILKTSGLLLLYLCVSTMIISVADEVSAQSETNIQGLVFGSFSTLSKTATTLGAYLGSVVLTLGGYDGAALVQSAGTITALYIGMIVPGMIMCAVVFFLILRKRPSSQNLPE